MRVLFKVRGFGGGAPLSMLEYMKVLKKENDVIALGSYYVNQDKYKTAGIETVDMPAFIPPAMFGNLKTIGRVKEFILKYKPDLYVGWTSGEAVFGRLLCKMLDLPFLMMYTGGEVPSYFSRAVNFEPIFVFSEENKRDLISQGYAENNIQVISNRMVFEKEITPAEVHYTGEKEFVEMLMPTRVASTKWNSILKAIQLAETANRKGIPTKLVIAGEGNMADRLNDLIAEVNQRNQATVVEYVGYVNDMISCFEKADVVLGKARSVIEPICMGRIGMIVSEDQKVWVSRKNSIENIYENNFSGRNMEKETSTDEIMSLFEAIQKGHLDVLELKDVGEWIRVKYDIHYAEERIREAFASVVDNHKKKPKKKFWFPWAYMKTYAILYFYKGRDLLTKRR